MVAWNRGKRVRQKKAFKLEDIWRIRIRLELEERLFELALFNLAIDSKLRSCDLRNLKVQDVSRSGCVMSRAIVKQQKTQQEVHFEITPKTQRTLSQCDHSKCVGTNRLPFPQSAPRETANFIPLLHHASEPLDDRYRFRQNAIRHAFTAPNQGFFDLR